jgi:hypothetical protein
MRRPLGKGTSTASRFQFKKGSITPDDTVIAALKFHDVSYLFSCHGETRYGAEMAVEEEKSCLPERSTPPSLSQKLNSLMLAVCKDNHSSSAVPWHLRYYLYNLGSIENYIDVGRDD